MGTITLEAKGDFQKAIKKHLEENALPALIEKINSGNKTLNDCQSYIYSEMRKRAQGGVAVATDQEIYGIAIHYFEEDSIKPSNVKINATVRVSEPKKEPVKAAVVKPSNGQIEGQLSLFG